MITEKQVDEILNPHGFSLFMYTKDKTEYVYSNMQGLAVYVYPLTNEFSIRYILDRSLIQINLPKCSPFYEEKPKYHQFEKMYAQFLKVLNKLEQ